MTLDPVDFLEAVASFTTAASPPARSARLATVDPAYSSGRPKVTFDGEEVLSDKGFPYAVGYVPTAGDRVVLLPVGTTYVILCEIAP